MSEYRVKLSKERKSKKDESTVEFEDDLAKMLEKIMMDDNDEYLTSSSVSTSTNLGEERNTRLVGEKSSSGGLPSLDLMGRVTKKGPMTTKVISNLAEQLGSVDKCERKYKTSSNVREGLSTDENFKFSNDLSFHSSQQNFMDIHFLQLDKLKNISNKNSSSSIKVENFPDFISPAFYSSFKGKFKYLIQNYNGSRLLQKSIEHSDPQIISLIFQEIKNDIPELICHQYGNYFCQKFYMLLQNSDKIHFLEAVTSKLVTISSNSIGNYPLQTIIENLFNEAEQNIIIEEISQESTLQAMIADSNAVHVLEKILSRFDEQKIPFLYSYVLTNFLSLVVTQNGLGLVKKVVAHSYTFITRKRIQKLLVDNFLYLIQNIYGNYSIQVAIEAIVQLFIEEIVSFNKIPQLIRNNYGNYVLQKALMIASPSLKILLINNILQVLGNLEDKKLIVKWKHICDSNMHYIINSTISNQQMNINYDPCIYSGNNSVYGGYQN